MVRPLLGLTLLLLTPLPVAAQQYEGRIIRRIAMEGLDRSSEPEILAQLRLRLGEPFSADAVSEETGRLYAMGLFSSIEPRVSEFEDGVQVIFRVVEKRLINRVTFDAVDVGSHKASIAERTLRQAIASRAGGLFTELTLQLDEGEIEQAYRDKGYLFVDVAHRVTQTASGDNVVFLIQEGPRVRIREIRFRGNRTVPAGTLQGQMVTKEKDFLFGIFHPGYYDRSELKRDVLENLTDYYKSIGFFDVLVAVDDVEFGERLEDIVVTILVEEGPRYTFEGYRVEGNNVFSTTTLESLLSAKPGAFYSRAAMLADRAEILKYYKDRAYIDASVDAKTNFDYADNTVQIHLDIEEDHETYIDRVIIRGNAKTQDRVIRRELEFYPGEKFNLSQLEKSRSNLARLQIFQDVEYNLVDSTGDRNRKDVVVQVTEQPTGRLLIGFGVTSGFGLIGNFAVTKRNFDFSDLPESIYHIPESFTGAGQTLNIVLQPGTQRSLYQFSFTEPYVFESRNSLTLEGSSITILRRDFDEDRLSFRPSLGRAFDFDRDLIFSVGLRLEEVEVHHIDLDAAPDVFRAEGHTSIVALSADLLYDKVLQEPLEGPYAGHRERLSYEYGGGPLGGHLDLSKVEGSIDLFYPIFVIEEGNLHHVISLSSRFGLIEGHHDTEEIPIFERIFLGGPNTVRGFRFRGLGPHFGNDPLGGTAAWYGNLEYVFPLFRKFVRGVIFADYGNLETEISQFDLDKMRYTVGAGVRINFPFLGTPLPVGLYFGEALKHEDEDRPRVFLFTIGAPF